MLIWWSSLPTKLYFIGISYQQHEDLCEATLLAEKEVEAERIRKEGLNNICPYVDCSLSESQSLCPNQCDRRKLLIFTISSTFTNQYPFHETLIDTKLRSFSGNSSVAGIWFHTPDIGSDLVITHNTPYVPGACVLHNPSRNYLLQILDKKNALFPDRPR